MSSRADYLAKYLSSGMKEDKKKKKKKKHREPKPSNVVIATDPTIQLDKNEHEDEIEDEETELAPVKVELAGAKKEFKGFKRIDNGNEFVRETISEVPSGTNDLASEDQESKQAQQTVYRDATGRIIDIESRRDEFKKTKDEAQSKRSFTEIRTTEEEQERQQKQKYKPQQSNFEDPASVFQDDLNDDNTNSSTGFDKYTYTKGVNPPNRFEIRAGCFWDGIDRSNGFEELILRKQTEQKYNKMDTANEGYDLDYE
ncbi:Pre-mRNA-splicing factor of RES complex-domain-containing protein [Scheffersomyces xylosifermentans]|uniref:Pre-mRNA-splicing factor of RES complex-domain-containing protein n=1 Tax=Scheffersomyces xylosifermentans TaxID=1304137 RepID=UPI00315C9400